MNKPLNLSEQEALSAHFNFTCSQQGSLSAWLLHFYIWGVSSLDICYT